ncbi:MAG: hypothetical protein KDD52_07840 [Bdellovibrionales bacterium]|nr:hypothetical protein [Bdellovibrionales bacterium]
MLASISQNIMDPGGMALSKAEYGEMFFFLLSGVLVVPMVFPYISRRFTMESIYRFSALLNVIYLAVVLLCIYFGFRARLAYILLAFSSVFGGAANSLTISNLQFIASQLFQEKAKNVTIFIHALVSIGASAGPGVMAVTSSYVALSTNLFAFVVLSVFPIVFSFFVSHDMKKVAAVLQQDEMDNGKFPLSAKLFLFLCVGYGFIEGFSGNWGVTFVEVEKNQDRAFAQSCLSLIWFFITVGRLSVLFLMKKIPPTLLHVMAPLVMIVGVMLLLSGQDHRGLGIGFSILGLGLSYFFPMTVAISMERFPFLRSKLASYSSGAVMIGFAAGSVGVGIVSEYFSVALSSFFSMSLLIALLLAVTAFYVHKNQKNMISRQ